MTSVPLYGFLPEYCSVEEQVARNPVCVCVCLCVCMHAYVGVYFCVLLSSWAPTALIQIKGWEKSSKLRTSQPVFVSKKVGFFFSELGPRVKFRLFTACSVFQNIFSNTFLDLILSDWPVLPVDVCFSRHKDVQVRRIKLHTLNK